MTRVTQEEIRAILEQYNVSSRLLQADDYQTAALRTRSPEATAVDLLIWPNTAADLPKDFDPKIVMLLHAILGIADEAGELAKALKVALFYRKDLNADNVVEEAGDLLWYIALGLHAVGRTMSECMRGNISKLAARYGEKFSEDAANSRDVAHELNSLRSQLDQKESPFSDEFDDGTSDYDGPYDAK